MDGGKCIIESCGSMPKVHHHCLIAFVCVLVWLEGMSLRTAPEEKVANAFVLCMCMQGKHRSMYFARVLFAALELVLKSLKIKSELQFHWAACERVMASVKKKTLATANREVPLFMKSYHVGCITIEKLRNMRLCLCWTSTKGTMTGQWGIITKVLTLSNI